MIRFLQKENRLTKALFVVIIAAASVSMVVYLIPGLAAGGAVSSSDYAVVYPRWWNKVFSNGDEILATKVEQAARQQIQQRNPAYADNPMIMNFFTQQVGQQMVEQQVLLQEADRQGIGATKEDVANYLHSGPTGAVIFPNGNYIGDQQYAALVNNRLNLSVTEFEENIRKDIILQRLRKYVTGGVTVADNDVRSQYLKDNIKIKFDYAVLSSDDLRKTINPSDSELEAYFTKNAAVRYKNAVPEQRKITYFAFTPQQLPGGIPQPTQQEIQTYYNQHKSQYSAPETATSRHILVKLDPGADAKADAAAKAKAEDVLKQAQNGGKFAELAKKYSDDPGSKDNGGELGPSQRGRMVPEFDNAIFTQKIGDTKMVKSQFGYHIVQVESRQAPHEQPLNEVQTTIQLTLTREKLSQAQENYARQLTDEANRQGLDKTAAAHHLELTTTPAVPAGGTISALPDGSQIISKAFQAKQGDPAQNAPTGEGYAVFQVTGVEPAHAPTFADWKSHVLDDYRNDQLPALLNTKTKELADKAQASHDLSKAAKEVGATVKTSDLVGLSSQVPDFGDVGQVGPQLFDMSVGNISGPINAGRTGVVAKLLDKKEPTAQEIQQNFDRQRDQILNQRQEEAFNLFASNVMGNYKKRGLIRINPKSTAPEQGE
jgi:peptidyl-prolyl cis-trans isomerase D